MDLLLSDAAMLASISKILIEVLPWIFMSSFALVLVNIGTFREPILAELVLYFGLFIFALWFFINIVRGFLQALIWINS